MLSLERAFGLVLVLILYVEVAPMPADVPKPAPHDVKVYSANKKFYAVSFHAAGKTAVFPAAPSRSNARWEISGYAPVLFLSDDGAHLVEGYAGGNILDAGAKGTDPFLVFFESGRQVARIAIADVFPHLESLPATTSGRAWGDFWGFEGPTRFGLVLQGEKKVWFDARSGKRLP